MSSMYLGTDVQQTTLGPVCAGPKHVSARRHERLLRCAAAAHRSRELATGLNFSGLPGRGSRSSRLRLLSFGIAERTQLAEPGTSQSELGWLRGFNDHYQIGQQLGRGSFGTVSLATEMATGQECAVKVIPKQRQGATVEHILSKIQQEVEILRRMQGRPEALRLHAVFELHANLGLLLVLQDDDHAYVVTEVCHGGNLEQFLQAQGALTEQEAAQVIHDVLSVLSECHRQHIIYADVKPATFLLKQVYPDARSLVDPSIESQVIEVRVADFGCSQHIRQGEKMGKKTGTPLYMAPELFMRYWGVQSDMWSAGMLLYQMLSGHLPFWRDGKDRNPLGIMTSILSDDIEFEGAPWDSISDEARDFVTRLLDRDYNLRLTAAEALEHPWLLKWCADEEGCTVVNDAVQLRPPRPQPVSSVAGPARHH